MVMIGGGFARLLAQSGAARPSGAPVAGYTLVTGVSLGASSYCPEPGQVIQFLADVSGEGDAGATVRVEIKTAAGDVITSCNAIPGAGCSASYTVPNTPGTVRVRASARGTQGQTRTSAPVTEIVVQAKQWRAEPALVAGNLSPKRQTPGQQTPPPPAEPQPGEEPPAETPPFVAPQGQRRFAPGSTVKLTVVEAEDKDTCSRCGVDQAPEADVIKYLWTQGGEGTTDAITVTMPGTQGETIEVAVDVDDEANLNGDGGTRDDEAVALTMTLYAAYPDPNDPDPDDDGLPNSMDDDDDGDGDPDITDPTPRPDTPVTPPAPAPQAIGLTATAQNPTTVQLSWSGAATKLYRSTQANFTPGADTLIAENEASVTTHADTGLTPQTTYHYILVPNGNPDLTQGGASATTPALTAITLTATAEDATTIELSWSGAAGTLYRSPQEGFAIGAETHIARGDAETDATQTSYTDTELTPETTYYYALVPGGNPDLTEGRANATTPDLERSAEASFKLLKSNGDEAGDTIGGTVKVVLELELENAEAGSENAVVRIQETGTENEVTHEPEEDHIDLPVDLTNEAGWQQWLDPDGDGPQPASWQAATSAPVGTGKWRRLSPWNTAGLPVSSGEAGTPQYSRLLNHNGEHTISLVEVDGGEGTTLEFGEETADVEDENVEVGNLVIVEAFTSDEDNPDYFRFDPNTQDSPFANPTVSFKFQDNGEVNQYHWRLRVRSTDVSSWSQSTLFEGQASVNELITVDLLHTDSSLESTIPRISTWGTYTFEINVREINSAGSVVDQMDYRTSNLYIPNKMPSPNQTKDGHYMRFEDAGNERKILLSYYLQNSEETNGTPAGSLKADVLEPSLDIVATASNLPTASNTPQLDFEVSRFPIEEFLDGVYISVITGTDGLASKRRSHLEGRLLARNNRVFSESSRYDLHVWYDSLSPVTLTPAQKASMESYISSVFDGVTTNFVDDTGRLGLDIAGAPYSDGIQVYWHSGPTAGAAHSYSPVRALKANVLSAAQMRGQRPAYQTVILSEPPTMWGTVLEIGGVGGTLPYDASSYSNGRKDQPILCVILINSGVAGPPPPPVTQEQMQANPGMRPPISGNANLQYYSNAVLHELLHAANGDKKNGTHCATSVATCIFSGGTTTWYNTDMRTLNSVTTLDDTGAAYVARAPFHAKAEIHAVLDNMKHAHR